MKNFKNYIYILAATAFFAACKPSIDTPNFNHGTADFTRYISVGNSLTSGYADGGLYLAGQQNSFPSMIATQMQAVGGGSFSQPLFSAAQSNGSGYIKLTGFDANGSPITAAVTTNLAYRDPTFFTKYTGNLENYGVPGIKLLHITLPYYGNLNPYFERLLPGVAPANTNTSYLSFITTKPFTFFTNWLGNNDALGYATGGGGGYTGADALTDKATFASLYNLLINSLTATGAKGACATIPDVTTIPYFTTVTPGLLLAGAQAAAQKAGVTPLPAAIYITASTNAAATTYGVRAATASDLVTLTFPTALLGKPTTDPVSGAVTNPYPYGLHPNNPIDSKYILDPNEVALVKDYVSSYNATIKSVAAAKGLAVFDAFTFLTNLKNNGLTVNGVNLTSGYISGGVFSLDGVHLTPRGYAIVANEFIKAINSQYSANVPQVNVANYNGVVFP
ncbi:GDSL-like lipase/acylhydrolase family protein [Mucilaginibacter gracilis]|uniref:GDSL-like lipase/acylhydrolase family protein n=1 Tax=Mucilaginibacter gracilis TaxID=423350 RepID=A0A495J953_9SPHI|nr:SGNH/GDSL hydrolase family protein [Mucilaginibacter gracilis]RKR85008.1 GDSL-like lipase/acylhydrolase family protein [Mucilaginibacter gracilis]